MNKEEDIGSHGSSGTELFFFFLGTGVIGATVRLVTYESSPQVLSVGTKDTGGTKSFPVLK